MFKELKHLMMFASHFIMLYTIKLYSTIGQLYLNNTGRNKKGSYHKNFHRYGNIFLFY